MGYREVVERETQLVGYRGDLFTKWLGLPISLRITRVFLKYDISENSATLLMWLVGIIGSCLLILGPIGQILGLFMMIFHHILDYVDGQLARERGTSSIHGSVMDRWNHYTVQMFFYFMLAVSLYQEHQNMMVFILISVFVFWNQFRNLIVNMPFLIYCNEMNGYHPAESRIIVKNYRFALEENQHKVGNSEVNPDNGNHEKTTPTWRTQIRSASTSFDFMSITLFLAAVVDVLIEYLYMDAYIFIGVVSLLSLYYLFNFVDYSLQFLLSKHIYHQVKNVESNLKNK